MELPMRPAEAFTVARQIRNHRAAYLGLCTRPERDETKQALGRDISEIIAKVRPTWTFVRPLFGLDAVLFLIERSTLALAI
jgi:hypothetical protein